jgi:hypothetical protein
MNSLARNKSLFVGLSCLSVACLIGSFANPLQQLEVYRQVEQNGLGIEYERSFIINESDSNLPYGFDLDRSTKISQIYHDSKFEKVMLVIAAFTSAFLALHIGEQTCLDVEIVSEISELKAKGRKQILVEGIKHRMAMASKSQRLLFMDEMKALIEEFGSTEGELLEADETNETDKFTAANYLLADGYDLDAAVTQVWGVVADSPVHRKLKAGLIEWIGESDANPQTSDVAFRELFPESMDSTCLKAICKAREAGVSDEDIVRDVLDCSIAQVDVGMAYLAHLSRGVIQG